MAFLYNHRAVDGWFHLRGGWLYIIYDVLMATGLDNVSFKQFLLKNDLAKCEPAGQ